VGEYVVFCRFKSRRTGVVAYHGSLRDHAGAVACSKLGKI
jgi:hypothetical protein